jgi:ubiquinone/menaquinone biosynthesis C-methylase UbiE
LINPFKLLERVGLREGDQVADMGCGELGHFVFPAAQMVGNVGRVYAVDVQRQALDRVERIARDLQYWNVQTVWSDFEVYNATHIPADSLDLVLFINNLYLCQNREHALQEMARLTKAGGHMAVVEWKEGPSPLGPPADRRIGAKEAKKVMHTVLFELVDEFEAGPSHYGLLYRRTKAIVQ